MNIQEEVIKRFYKNDDYINGSLNIKKHKTFVDDVLIPQTSFLDSNATLQQRLWHIVNSIYNKMLCTENKPIRFKSAREGYVTFCADSKCKCKQDFNKSRAKKLVEYNLNRTPEEITKTQVKIADTNMRRYGETCVFKSDVIKDKIKNTNLERYGVENPKQSLIIDEKIKATNLLRYGVENPYNIPNIQKKCNINSQCKSANEKRKKTNLERYGVEYGLQSHDIQQKCKVTLFNNHGVYYTIHSKLINDKITDTNSKRYCAKYPFQSDIIKDKIKNTNLERYGVENVFKSEIIKDKIKNSNLERYGYTHFMQSHFPIDITDINNWIDVSSHSVAIDKFNGIAMSTILRYGRLYKPNLFSIDNSISLPHKIINEFLDSIDIEYIINTRKIISPLELDIFIPSHNLAIEINGAYWHTETKGKDKSYHLNKTDSCLESGIELLHFWDTDIINKPELIKSMIKAKLGLNCKLMARKCIVGVVDSITAKEFFNNNHIQGHINSKLYKGLFYNNELVSCISISKPRFNKDYDYEVYRFATKQGFTVVGAFSKLIKNSGLKGKFISYANRMISNGNVYLSSGWEFVKNTPPSYQYTKNYKLFYNRVKFQKHKLKDLLDNYQPDLTEKENMINNGFHLVWDSGTKVYSFLL